MNQKSSSIDSKEHVKTEAGRGYEKRWIALAFVMISLLVMALDNSVLNVALPSISKDLGASATGLQWIVDAYVLCLAGTLLTFGSIGDRFGRKKVLLAGLGAFGVLSLGAALSTSTWMLIAMRALTGIAGAAIMPSTLSILTATFRDSKERAQAIALWSATFALAMGIGPLVGGWLLTRFPWNAVFYVNLPVAAAALAGISAYSQDSKAESAQKLDIPGCVLSILGSFSLVYAIIEAGNNGWISPNVLFAFTAAVILLCAFAFRELHTTHPLLPLRFFRNMSFAGANMALTLVAFTMFGCVFLLSQFLQTVQGYGPLESGVRLLPLAGAAFIGSAFSAKLARKIGTKFTVASGILLSAAGLFYFSRIAGVNTSYISIALGLVITALGFGFTMGPATNSVMGSVPVNEAGVGSAMNDTNRQVGGALGIAVLGTVLNSTYLTQLNQVKWPEVLSPSLVAAIKSSVQGAAIAAHQIPDAQISQLIIRESGQAFVGGMAEALLVASTVMLVTATITLLILPSRVLAYREPIGSSLSHNREPNLTPEV